MGDYYILDGKTPIATNDPAVWAKWRESRRNEENWIVAKTETLNGLVSTVFLGLDHSFGNGPPLLFETLVFGGTSDGDMERYSTWEEAEIGHKQMIRHVQNELGDV